MKKHSGGDILQKLVEEYLINKNMETLGKIYVQLIPFLSGRAHAICSNTKQEHEDVMQDLFFVLEKRLKSYDSSKGKFLTYLHNTMRGDPTDALQAMVKKRRGGDGKTKYLTPVSLNKKIYDEGQMELHEIIPSDLNVVRELILNTDLRDITKGCTKKFEKQIEELSGRRMSIKSKLNKKTMKKLYRYLKQSLRRE